MKHGRTIVRGADLAWEIGGSGPAVVWGHGLSMDRASDADMALVDWARLPVTLLRYDAAVMVSPNRPPTSTGTAGPSSPSTSWRWPMRSASASTWPPAPRWGAAPRCMPPSPPPIRVRALVLVIPPTGWEARAAQAEQWELSATLIENEGVDALIAARAEMAPPDPYVGDEARRDRQAEWSRSWDPARLAHVMRGATRANLPAREVIATLTMPTLILAWTGDPIHPVSTADELARLLPHAEVHLASTLAELDTWTDRVAAFL